MRDFVDGLERELTRVAHKQSVAVPPQAGRYRSVGRPSGRLALGGLGVLCVVAAVTIALVLGLSGARPQSAFAGWSPIPSRASSAQAAGVAAACASGALQNPLGAVAGESGASAAHSEELRALPTIKASEWSAVLTEARGPYVTVILEADEGRATASCLFGPPAPNVPTSALATDPSYDGLYSLRANAGVSSKPASPVPAGKVSVSMLEMNGHTPAEQRHHASRYGFIEGRTGKGVTGVTLVLEEGTQVQATVANGWFLAWWPGSERALTAEITTPGGTATESLHDAGSESPSRGEAGAPLKS